jgi:hypothetical protein
VHRFLFVFLLLFAAPLAAQVPPTGSPPGQAPPTAQVPVGDTVMVADTIPHEGATPRGAFARALIVPGWGHFSIGANRRGAVFVALQGASWFMLVKTLRKLDRANDNLDTYEAIATDSLNVLIATDPDAAERLADPLAFEEAVGQHPLVADTRGLVGAREEQRQDWITYTLFFTMASAVDAYVAAYLRDFPVDASVTAQRDGGVGLLFRMPVGGIR